MDLTVKETEDLLTLSPVSKGLMRDVVKKDSPSLKNDMMETLCIKEKSKE